jgi:hypothetical protein
MFTNNAIISSFLTDSLDRSQFFWGNARVLFCCYFLSVIFNVCERISVRALSPSRTTAHHHLCVDRGACVLTRGFLFTRFCEMGKFGVIDGIPPQPGLFISWNQNYELHDRFTDRAYCTDQCYHFKLSL